MIAAAIWVLIIVAGDQSSGRDIDTSLQFFTLAQCERAASAVRNGGSFGGRPDRFAVCVEKDVLPRKQQ